MPVSDTSATLLRDCEAPRSEVLPAGGGDVAMFSVRSPIKTTPNEDAAVVVPLGSTRCVLAVADGLGGGPAGERAAALTLDAVCDALRANPDHLRDAILDGFEAANRKVTGIAAGAATTLAAVEIDGDTCRTYHAGDSCAVVFGQRGLLKLQTVPHSPTGYAVEAGVMEEDEALGHDERHLVSNVIGSTTMKIEIGPSLVLAARDTLVLATDGLFDNLRMEEIVEIMRAGPLERAASTLAQTCADRMAPGGGGGPDDLTFIAYRPRRTR